jgi:hypothetical protein
LRIEKPQRWSYAASPMKRAKLKRTPGTKKKPC